MSTEISTKPLPLEFHGLREKVGKWRRDTINSEAGNPLPILANVHSALTILFPDLLAFDQMAQTAILLQQIDREETDFEPRPLTDIDVAKIQESLQFMGLKHVTRDTMHQAVQLRAHERRFHPVKDYLNGLTWDGIPRLRGAGVLYFGTDASPIYSELVFENFSFRWWLEIFEPGCKADHVVVLEGPQGTLKSTACRVIAGKWFSDGLPDITKGKEASQHLNGKWVVEVSEMSAMGRAEAAQLKSFISRQEERYRPAYGRLEVHEPRQVIFIGTTNESTYLRDPTGGRRFWPIKCGMIHIDKLERDRDQLFAEAVTLYKRGEPWWVQREIERDFFQPEQAVRFEADPWEQAIAAFLDGRKNEATIGEIASGALGFETKHVGTREQRRITSILETIGWQRTRKLSKGQMWGMRQ